MCTHTQVVDVVMPHLGDPKAAADAVVRTAFQRGSEDNLTAVVVMFGWQMERLEELQKKWGGV